MSDMNDYPIRLKDHNTKFEMYVSQLDLDGLIALIYWLDGFETSRRTSGAGGFIPGSRSLVNIYRIMNNQVKKSYKQEREV